MRVADQNAKASVLRPKCQNAAQSMANPAQRKQAQSVARKRLTNAVLAVQPRASAVPNAPENKGIAHEKPVTPVSDGDHFGAGADIRLGGWLCTEVPFKMQPCSDSLRAKMWDKVRCKMRRSGGSQAYQAAGRISPQLPIYRRGHRSRRQIIQRYGLVHQRHVLRLLS